jgi:hypothetical protein
MDRHLPARPSLSWRTAIFRRFTGGTANVAKVGTRASLDGIGMLKRAVTMATWTRIPIRDTEGRRFLIMAIGTGGESGATGSGIKSLDSLSAHLPDWNLSCREHYATTARVLPLQTSMASGLVMCSAIISFLPQFTPIKLYFRNGFCQLLCLPALGARVDSR